MEEGGFGSVGISLFSHKRHNTKVSAAPQNLAEAMPVPCPTGVTETQHQASLKLIQANTV